MNAWEGVLLGSAVCKYFPQHQRRYKPLKKVRTPGSQLVVPPQTRKWEPYKSPFPLYCPGIRSRFKNTVRQKWPFFHPYATIIVKIKKLRPGNESHVGSLHCPVICSIHTRKIREIVIHLSALWFLLWNDKKCQRSGELMDPFRGHRRLRILFRVPYDVFY
jgi:hypothetical protein